MADEMAVGEQPQYNVIVNDTPKFDLTSYISNYKGRTVFRRLYLIASCSIPLRQEAARLAVVEAKKGTDVKHYHEAAALLRSVSDGKDVSNLIDTNWAVEQERRNIAETKRMENELKQYKNNLIRESIRMGNEDLGSHYHSIGDLGSAVKAFSRMREYCTSPAHIASTAFRIVAVAVEQRSWLAVQSQVQRIKNLQMRPEDSARTQPKTAAAMGLQQMSLGEYREAAFSFLSTDPNLGDTYNDVITSNDVAVYGGLCALASMTRSELQTHVLESADFRNFLELEPHIRRAIASFCASKYSQCLDVLESYRADYLLDIYLQGHVAAIYQRIRTKSIVQYFQPFSKVTLESMENMFGSPSTTMLSSNANQPTRSAAESKVAFQNELITLIMDGKLNARIDLERGVLVAKETDQRAVTQKKALETVDRFILEARMKLIRLNVIHAGLEVKPLQTKKKDFNATVGGPQGQGAGIDLGSLVDLKGDMSGNSAGAGMSAGLGGRHPFAM